MPIHRAGMFIYLDLADCRKIYDTWMVWVLLDTMKQYETTSTVYSRHFCKDVFRSGSSMLALLDARLSSVSGTKVTGSTGKPKEKKHVFSNFKNLQVKSGKNKILSC